jgi:hypothetical protein
MNEPAKTRALVGKGSVAGLMELTVKIFSPFLNVKTIGSLSMAWEWLLP